MRHFSIDPAPSENRPRSPHNPNYWAATIDLGETVTVENKPSGNFDVRRGPARLEDAPPRMPGPPWGWAFHVNGVKAGDWIAIHIEDIQTAPYGYIRRNGPFIMLPAAVVPVRDGRVIFPGGASVRARPMLGYVAVETERQPRPGQGIFGGNHDNPAVVAGTVFHVKAQLDVGWVDMCDCHAVQGDGEIPGAGVEIESTTRFRVERSEGFTCRGPVLETPTEWQTYGVKRMFEDSIREAFYEMVEMVRGKYGLSYEEANILVGVAGSPRANGIYGTAVNLGSGSLGSDVNMRVTLPKNLSRIR